ncbi:VCBS repeat-containing protein [Bradyrhizobium sp. GM7.3]
MPNSLAVIGTPTVSFVTEDANLLTLTAQGSISITDTNAGQAFFKTSVIASSGDLGSLSIAANGSYVYSVADSKVQYLGAGETKVDTFTVTSLDGTTKQVAFTIVGVNDTAMIGTPTVVDVTEDATSPILKATGSISITDADQNQAAFKTTVASAAGNLGTLVLQSNGSYTYSVADSAVQYLGAGQVKTDTFTVTSLDGTPKLICFNVHGTNDAAVIGTPDHHDVTEDASNPNLSVTGSISITDADQGQSAFKTIVNSASGNLGSLVLAANGTYTYSVANAATQYLGAGDTKVDTFTVTSLDGTQKQISFTIHGINDAAVIGVPTVHDVTEDAATPVIYATGTVSITDADQGESAFQPTLQAGNGNLGALVMGSNGAYIYAVLDSAVQYLGAGETKVDSFTLTALDGTSKVVAFTIHGTNDAAVIGAPAVHDVAEDVGVSTAGNLSAAGTLSISDADQNQASFQTTVTAAAGTLGHLSIAADGAYSYTVADSAVQYLGASDSKVEIFTVTAFDGTQKQVSFTIHGANDAAAIGTPTVHDVTKNASPTTLTATGVISVTDADQNQASFQTTVGSAAGNLGHLVIAANGAYTYSVANSATQYLGAADVKVDTFTVTSLDGTPKQVTFTIHGGSGAGTPATIGNPSNATVTEDVGGATLTAIGTILVTDPDAGQAAFQTTVAPGSGNLGGLVLPSNGSYTYSVADSAVQHLGAGEAKVDTFTMQVDRRHLEGGLLHRPGRQRCGNHQRSGRPQRHRGCQRVGGRQPHRHRTTDGRRCRPEPVLVPGRVGRGCGQPRCARLRRQRHLYLFGRQFRGAIARRERQSHRHVHRPFPGRHGQGNLVHGPGRQRCGHHQRPGRPQRHRGPQSRKRQPYRHRAIDGHRRRQRPVLVPARRHRHCRQPRHADARRERHLHLFRGQQRDAVAGRWSDPHGQLHDPLAGRHAEDCHLRRHRRQRRRRHQRPRPARCDRRHWHDAVRVGPDHSHRSRPGPVAVRHLGPGLRQSRASDDHLRRPLHLQRR